MSNPPANPNAALLEAAATGDCDAAARALDAGAQLETRDASGRTPLLLAAAEDYVDVAQMLIALGADPQRPGSGALHPLASHRRDRQRCHARSAPPSWP